MKINWSKEKTYGVLIGVLWPLMFLPVVLFVLSQSNAVNFMDLWYQVLDFHEFRSRYISLSLISNIGWFYFFLNREKYDIAYGIMFGMLAIYGPYMAYVNLFM